MKIEDQCVSLELAKVLRELGVKQDSLFYHTCYERNHDYKYAAHKIFQEKLEEFDEGKWKCKTYSAFTSGEIGELLVNLVTTRKYHKELWECRYLYMEHEHKIHDKTEANCRGKMLIHLIENKLMEIK